jgi:pimeloyl-ACP methyl ester carboxylesterase
MASVGLPLENVTGQASRHSLHRPLRVRATRYEQRDATVLGDVRLRYVDVAAQEESGPPLVLLHGIASRIEEYEDIIDPLRRSRRVVALDLPGNGYSDKPARRYTLSFLEDSVLALLDHLGVGRADLAGGSLGGNLVLRLGHREPQRFRRLVAWGPAGVWDPMRSASVFHTIASRMGTVLFWPMMWVQSRFWYHPRWRGRGAALAEAFAHYREILEPSFVRMYFDLCGEQVRTSLFPIAPGITQATRIVWGDSDHALGMGEGVKRLVSLLPNASLCVVQGARHALAAEVPERLAREVDAFLTTG